jgi:ABC-2 type transport system permease protein
VDRDILELVRTGDVAHELLRPVEMHSLWFSRALAWRTATPFLRAVPMFLFAMILLPLVGLKEWALPLPPSLPAALAFIIMMVVAIMLSSALTTLLNISLIWTTSGVGLQMILNPLAWVFSGMIVPLPLLPPVVHRILLALPFAYLVDVPYRLYTGHLEARLLPGYLLAGAGWAIVLFLFGRYLMRRARARLVVHGG